MRKLICLFVCFYGCALAAMNENTFRPILLVPVKKCCLTPPLSPISSPTTVEPDKTAKLRLNLLTARQCCNTPELGDTPSSSPVKVDSSLKLALNLLKFRQDCPSPDLGKSPTPTSQK